MPLLTSDRDLTHIIFPSTLSRRGGGEALDVSELYSPKLRSRIPTILKDVAEEGGHADPALEQTRQARLDSVQEGAKWLSWYARHVLERLRQSVSASDALPYLSLRR